MSAMSRYVLDLPQGSRVAEAMQEQAALSDAHAYAAYERYESRLLEESRAIAKGATSPAPTAEHIRVLLDALYRLEPHQLDESPF